MRVLSNGYAYTLILFQTLLLIDIQGIAVYLFNELGGTAGEPLDVELTHV